MEILQFVWDPTSEGFTIFGKFTIYYYSLMWMLAFILGFYIMQIIYKKEGLSTQKLDSLFVYTILGTMIGARLGHVIFYQIELFDQDFFSVFLPFRFNPTFEFTGFRGLASHGAAIGIIIAMYLYNTRVLKKSVLWILDRILIPVAIGGAFIRIGNFFNSEIVGKETESSFGVVFSKLGEDFARHPAQLYEAFSYIVIFFIVAHIYWRTEKIKKTGYLFGLFFVLLWSSRFIVEFFKQAQVDGREDWIFGMNTGQTLSIPFILIGLYLMFRNKAMNTDYIVAFTAAIIYGFTAHFNPFPLSYFWAVIGALVLSLMITGIIKIFASTKFSKIYMWTTVVISTLAGLGNIISTYYV